MANKKMKSLTIGDDTYEIVDEITRSESVRFTAQELTEEQKAQARLNIGAAEGENPVTETLERLFAASAPNAADFSYTLQESGSTFIFEDKQTTKRKIKFDFDPAELTNFAINMYLFDEAGTPYKHTGANGWQDYEKVSFSSEDTFETIEWASPGGQAGFMVAKEAFEIVIPEGCQISVCTRLNRGLGTNTPEDRASGLLIDIGHAHLISSWFAGEFTINGTTYKGLTVTTTTIIEEKTPVLCNPQNLTEEQKAQARENIGATTDTTLSVVGAPADAKVVGSCIEILSEDTKALDEKFKSLEGKPTANDIVENQEWKLGYYYANGGFEGVEIYYKSYGYVSTTANKLPVEAGKPYYYVYSVPADKNDRAGGSTDKLELTFCEFDSAGKWIQRNILALPTSTIEGTQEVVRGEYTPSANACFVTVSVYTFREDGNGNAVVSVYDDADYESNSRLLPEVNEADNGKTLKVERGKWVLFEETKEEEKEPVGFAYIGEKMPSKVNYFNSELLFTMSGSNLCSQDAEIYGDFYFVACSITEQIRVYSLENNAWLADLLIDVRHGSGMQFSGEFYDSNDTFPLLYVGGDGTSRINAIRITNNNGVWSASVVRTLYIPTAQGYWLAPSIDSKSNILYTYGYKINGYWNDDGTNAMKIARWDLNALTDNGDGTFTPALISECETPYLGVTQGRKFYGGNLYVAFAEASGAPHNARIVTVDAATGAVKADIDMTCVTLSEAEGLCYRIVGNDIHWYLNEYWSVFKLTF